MMVGVLRVEESVCGGVGEWRRLRILHETVDS